MELSNDEIKEMDIKEIFRLFFPVFKEIYQSTKYLDIPREDFIKLVLKEISISINSYNIDKPYKDFIKNRVLSRIIENEKELLNNQDEVSRIVNNYINMYFKEEFNYSCSVKVIKEFLCFINKYDLLLSPELIEELLKNTKLNSTVKAIVDNYSPNISISKVSKISNDYTFLSIIEIYALINDINIEVEDEKNIESKENIENDNYNAYLTDGLIEYIKGISPYEELSYQDCKYYYEKYLNGDMSARDKLIENSMRSVIAVAKTKIMFGVKLPDLIQYGNIGLLKALEKYDPNRGVKFNTYAMYWIKQSINNAIMNNEKTIRYPIDWYTGMKSYIEKYNSLANELDREPTDEEISERFKIPMIKILRYHQVSQDVKSLNELVSNNKDSDKEFGDFVLHTDDDEVEKEIVKKELRKDIKRAYQFAGLTEREIAIWEMSLGFYDNKPMSLQAIGDVFHISRARVQQIEAKVLRRLKKIPKAYNTLAAYAGCEEKKPHAVSEKVNNNINNSINNNINNTNFDDLCAYPKITICDSVSGIKDSTKQISIEIAKKKTRIKSYWD